MTPDVYASYAFGPFHLDGRQQRLRRDGQDIELTRTLFRILYFLVQHSRERLSKEDIIAAVWTATVEEQNLTRQISTLRMHLDDDPDNPTYIKTIPGFGYEFIAPVTQAATAEQSFAPSKPTSADTITDDVRLTKLSRPRARLRRLTIAGIVILAISLIGGLWWRSRPADPSSLRVEILNCDDECTLFLNETEVLHTSFGQPPSGWRDITSLLRPGKNELRLSVWNDFGAIAYGLKISKGGIVVVNEQCGVAHRIGCNDNEPYPHGPVLEIVHTFHK